MPGSGALHGLEPVGQELDRWGEAGLVADFWWRDDDAGWLRPELGQALGLARDLAIPLHLSVIPSVATAQLFANAGDPAAIRVLQHGWSHTNHEPAAVALSEFGDGRRTETALEELELGHRRLIDLFGRERVLPVLVPPWNSISPVLVAALPRLGVHGLSALGPRRSRLVAPGVVQINTHVDITDWQHTPCFRGLDRVVPQLVGHLRARRVGEADAAEPTGVLTHHWASDSDAWRFLESLGRIVVEHSAARWVTPDWR